MSTRFNGGVKGEIYLGSSYFSNYGWEVRGGLGGRGQGGALAIVSNRLSKEGGVD